MSDSGSDSDSDIEMPQLLPPVHAAVLDLDVDALRRALAAGANVDALYSGKTPLFVVCQASPPATMTPPIWREKVREREAIVAALLRAGANVDATYRGLYITSHHLTPLMAAVFNRDFPPSSIVAQLIAAGADI